MSAVDIVNRYLRLCQAGSSLSSGDFNLKLHTEEDLIDLALILDLVSRDPGELAFVVDTEDYIAYINTYIEAGGSKEEVVYSREEYYALKNYFVK